MARKNRFELVLSDEELAEIQGTAKHLGISAAAYIRRCVFDMRDQTAIKAPPVDVSVPEPPETDAKEITRLAKERHPHLPLIFAERRVREEGK